MKTAMQTGPSNNVRLHRIVERRLRYLTFVPVVRQQRDAPNILWFCQLDSAVSGLVRIDVHNLCRCIFVCAVDMNGDFHPYPQRNGSHHQCPMENDDDGSLLRRSEVQ